MIECTTPSVVWIVFFFFFWNLLPFIHFACNKFVIVDWQTTTKTTTTTGNGLKWKKKTTNKSKSATLSHLYKNNPLMCFSWLLCAICRDQYSKSRWKKKIKKKNVSINENSVIRWVVDIHCKWYANFVSHIERCTVCSCDIYT